MSTPAQSLHQLLTLLGLTLPILSARTGISRSRLDALYKARNPSALEIARLTEALGAELVAHFTTTPAELTRS